MLVSGGKTDIEIEHQNIQDMRIQAKGTNTPVGEPSQKLVSTGSYTRLIVNPDLIQTGGNQRGRHAGRLSLSGTFLDKYV